MMRQAAYFKSGSEMIFSLFHPAQSEKEIREGVLICPPAPFETRRSHRALRNLAQNLSRSGFDVLRIDYRGTSDSSGDYRSWSLSAWQEDIHTAYKRLREVHGAERVTVFGLRLGASLAWKELYGQSIKRFVLWDPIFEGIEYYDELMGSHEFLCQREVDRPPFMRSDSRPQALGFALNEGWISELKDFSLAIPKNARGVIVQSHDSIRGRDIGKFVRVEVENDDQQWSNPLVLQFQSFAHPSISAIEQAIERLA